MSIKRIFIVISAIFAASAVFADNSSVTSKKYVDDLMSGYQGKLAGSGANTLMIYDNSEDGIGEKSIAATLGNSASAVSVPTVGAVKTGLDGKQDTITGTAGYVMTGTGTPGEVGERAIYSANTNYSDSLVTAETVNSGVINAVNSSLRRVNANGELDNNGTLWEIADTVMALSYLPTGYTQLEYLKFVNGASTTNGTWINTGIYLTNNHTIRVKVNSTYSTGGFAGVMGRFSSSGPSFQLYGGYFRFGTLLLKNTISNYLGQTIILSFGQDGLFVNDTLIATPTQQTFTQTAQMGPCLIGSIGSNDSTFAGEIYEAWIELNGTVIAHYIPARNSSGVLGMYDLVDPNPATAFHTNAADGNFIAGPPVAQ